MKRYKYIWILVALYLFFPSTSVWAKSNTTLIPDESPEIRVALDQLHIGNRSETLHNKQLNIKHSNYSLSFSSEKPYTIVIAPMELYESKHSYKENKVLQLMEEQRAQGYSVGMRYNSHNKWSLIALDSKVMTGNTIAYQTVKNGNKGLLVMQGSSPLLLSYEHMGYPIFSTDEVALDLGKRQYRGGLEFSLSEENTIFTVNIVNIEEYLFSVVASEMGPSFHSEALKAQAIASRSYVLASIINRDEDSIFDLWDTTYSQAYKGYGIEAPSTTQAVIDTRGQVLCYKDDIIKAFYYSTSGGHTEASENVWVQPIPYLVGVSDLYESEPAASPWIVELSKEQVQDLLLEEDLDLGLIKDIKIVNTTSSGRVSALYIEGSKSSTVLEKNAIRKLGLKSTKFHLLEEDSISILGHNTASPSTLSLCDSRLYIQQTTGIEPLQLEHQQLIVSSKDNLYNYTDMSKVEDFIFVGMGYGHGVGMSQSGANGMAINGFLYEDILLHYYTDVSIQSIYN